jgi:hypothetical protein
MEKYLESEELIKKRKLPHKTQNEAGVNYLTGQVK